jgi:hypothetical protein
MKFKSYLFFILIFLCFNTFAYDALNKAKNECSEIGFTHGTEKYGDCVMDLYTRYKSSSTQNSKSNLDPFPRHFTSSILSGNAKKCFDFGFDRYTSEFSQCKLQLHQLDTQQALIDKQNEQNRQQQINSNILQFGLGLISGNNNTSSNTSLNLQSNKLRTNIRLPNGNTITCMKFAHITKCQ